MRESARYILQILVFIALILSVGTVGYLLIEDGITASDAFYMTATAITPAQFDEVHQLSTGGRYFTVVLVFCGFGAVVAFATQFARLIIQSELEGVGVITRKQMRRRIHQMKNHYIVCGYGEIGGAICSQLKDQQRSLVVITDDESALEAIDREGYARVKGNPTADHSLKEAEIEHAEGVIAVLPDDSDNLFIALAARELNPKIFIIARGEDASLEDRILRAGADIVVSPMKLGGRQIANLIRQQASASPELHAAKPESSVMGLGLHPYHHGIDIPITVADVIERFSGVGAAGIHRGDGSFEVSPGPEKVVHRNDRVVVITRNEHAGESFQRAPTGKTILLADDHRALRLLFARKLASAGHDVIQAADGDEALAMARRHRPDLIVLDVNMPLRNGYEVCSELKQEERFANCPIILYSGDRTAEFIKHGKSCGADKCIRKTSKSSELLATIDECFAACTDSENVTTQPAPEPGMSDAPNVDEPLDIEVALENVGGDRELLGEMAAAMLEETPRLIEQISIAIEQQDSESLRRASHKLQGSMAILGCRGVAAAATQLENADDQHGWEEVARWHEELQTRVPPLIHALEKHASSRVVS